MNDYLGQKRYLEREDGSDNDVNEVNQEREMMLENNVTQWRMPNGKVFDIGRYCDGRGFSYFQNSVNRSIPYIYKEYHEKNGDEIITKKIILQSALSNITPGECITLVYSDKCNNKFGMDSYGNYIKKRSEMYDNRYIIERSRTKPKDYDFDYKRGIKANEEKLIMSDAFKNIERYNLVEYLSEKYKVSRRAIKVLFIKENDKLNEVYIDKKLKNEDKEKILELIKNSNEIKYLTFEMYSKLIYDVNVLKKKTEYANEFNLVSLKGDGFDSIKSIYDNVNDFDNKGYLTDEMIEESTEACTDLDEKTEGIENKEYDLNDKSRIFCYLEPSIDYKNEGISSINELTMLVNKISESIFFSDYSNEFKNDMRFGKLTSFFNIGDTAFDKQVMVNGIIGLNAHVLGGNINKDTIKTIINGIDEFGYIKGFSNLYLDGSQDNKEYMELLCYIKQNEYIIEHIVMVVKKYRKVYLNMERDELTFENYIKAIDNNLNFKINDYKRINFRPLIAISDNGDKYILRSSDYDMRKLKKLLFSYLTIDPSMTNLMLISFIDMINLYLKTGEYNFDIFTNCINNNLSSNEKYKKYKLRLMNKLHRYAKYYYFLNPHANYNKFLEKFFIPYADSDDMEIYNERLSLLNPLSGINEIGLINPVTRIKEIEEEMIRIAWANDYNRREAEKERDYYTNYDVVMFTKKYNMPWELYSTEYERFFLKCEKRYELKNSCIIPAKNIKVIREMKLSKYKTNLNVISSSSMDLNMSFAFDFKMILKQKIVNFYTVKVSDINTREINPEFFIVKLSDMFNQKIIKIKYENMSTLDLEKLLIYFTVKIPLTKNVYNTLLKIQTILKGRDKKNDEHIHDDIVNVLLSSFNYDSKELINEAKREDGTSIEYNEYEEINISYDRLDKIECNDNRSSNCEEFVKLMKNLISEYKSAKAKLSKRDSDKVKMQADYKKKFMEICNGFKDIDRDEFNNRIKKGCRGAKVEKEFKNLLRYCGVKMSNVNSFK